MKRIQPICLLLLIWTPWVWPQAVRADGLPSALPGDMAQSALTGADRTAIVRIIRDQMAAFRRDDGVAAFSYAAPRIRRQFGSAENFMRMVRTGYQPVYRPRRVEFLDLVNTKGQWVQKVGVVGPGGEEVTALYLMKRQKEGGWKIGGCVLVRPEGKRI